MDTHQVLRGGKEISLSGKEFALLRYMVQNEGIVLSRERLEEHLWNFDYSGGSNVIDVYIRYLRRKIDDGQEKKLIHTAVSYTHLILGGAIAFVLNVPMNFFQRHLFNPDRIKGHKYLKKMARPVSMPVSYTHLF